MKSTSCGEIYFKVAMNTFPMKMIKLQSLRSAESLVSLLGDGELDSLGLGK